MLRVGPKTLCAAIVLLVLASGCLDPSASNAEKSRAKALQGNGTAAAAARLLPTTLEVPKVVKALNLGTGSGEPNIAVAPDGTIYITPINNLYRSTDGGKTFTNLGPSKTSGHGDGDIAIDATGRLHWLGLGGQPPGGPIPYQYSDNQGDTFTPPRDLSARTGSDREWLDVTPDGVVYASWRGRASGQGVISVNVSLDNGLSWRGLSVMGPDGIGGPIVHGNAPGEVYEAITMFSTAQGAGDGKMLLARSYDYGEKWERKLIAIPAQSPAQFGLVGFPTSIFPVVAIDPADTLYVVFSADQQSVTPFRQQPLPKPATRFGVFLTVSKDKGDTWSPPKLISDPTKAAVMPWVAAGAAGRIAVTWYENVNGIPSDLLPDLWNVKLYESITADQENPTGVTVQLTSEPNHVGNICTSGTGCVGGRSLLDFFEVAIDNNGQPVSTWGSSNQVGGVSRQAVPTQIYFGTVMGTPLK